jgi:cytidylate kinase
MKSGVPAKGRALGPFLKTLALEVHANPEGTRIVLDGEDVTQRLSHPEVENNVSRYSAMPIVRTAMVRRQRAIAETGPAILAGRDIGTVVLPKAPLKFYLVASETARATRRAMQATQEAHEAHRDIANRDAIDSTRVISPLMPAEDAIIIDTTELSLDEVIAFALEKVTCAKN